MLLLVNPNIYDVSDHPGIDHILQIQQFQDKAIMELQDYVTRTYPEDTYRFDIPNTLA